MLKARAVEFDLDGLIESDQKRREFIIKTDEFKKRRNEIGNEISQKKKAGEDATAILDEMKNVSYQQNLQN